jgi:hypothetical protein
MAGHRHTTTDVGKKPRGRKRVRMEYIHSQATSYIHPDLLTALDKFDKRHTSLHSLLHVDDEDNEDNESEINNKKNSK